MEERWVSTSGVRYVLLLALAHKPWMQSKNSFHYSKTNSSAASRRTQRLSAEPIMQVLMLVFSINSPTSISSATRDCLIISYLGQDLKSQPVCNTEKI